jgi:hypothetical protein
MGEVIVGGAGAALTIIPPARFAWQRFGPIGKNLTKLETSAQTLGAAQKELATVNKLRSGAALETPEVAARAQAAQQAVKTARAQFADDMQNLARASNKELIHAERLSGINVRGELSAINKQYQAWERALSKLDDAKPGTTAYSKALNEVNVAKQNYLNRYGTFTEKLEGTSLIKSTRQFPVAEGEVIKSWTLSPTGELIETTATIGAGKPNLWERIMGRFTGEYGTPHQTIQGARYGGKQVRLWEEPIPLFEFKGYRITSKTDWDAWLENLQKTLGKPKPPEPTNGTGGGVTTQKIKAIDPATGRIVEREVPVPKKPATKVAVEEPLPETKVLTRTRIKPEYAPKTEAGPGTEAARDASLYGFRTSQIAPDQFITWRKVGGLWQPVYTTQYMPRQITVEGQREFTMPSPMQPKQPVTQFTEPTTTQMPSVVEIAGIEPAKLVFTAPDLSNLVSTGIKETTITTPVEATQPVTAPAPSIYVPVPQTTYTPPAYEVPPPITKISLPITKIPPPIVPPPLPGLSIYGGGGITRHGLASTYVKRFINIPELVVYLPTWEGLRPHRMDKRLWRKLGTLDEGVEFLGDEEFEMTPFGRKAVRTVVARGRLAGGAKSMGASAQPGITSVEEFNAPLKKKQVISKSKGKKVTSYEFDIQPNDIGAIKWVG